MVDTPDGCVAILRDLIRMEKWADRDSRQVEMPNLAPRDEPHAPAHAAG